MFAAAEKSHKPSTAVQRQQAAPFFARKHDGGGEKSFFSPSFIQPKLSISQPDDPAEKEADQMANQVMTMPEPATVSPATEKEEIQPREEEEKVQAKPEGKEEQPRSQEAAILPAEEKDEHIQRQQEKEEVQTKVFAGAASQNANAFPLHRQVNEEEDTSINRKEILSHSSTFVQRSGRGPPAENGHTFEQSLEASKGSGSALPSATRSFMESRFGADFGGVRIHTGERAVHMSHDIHAQAFTYGNDIYFNSGKYAPGSPEGQHLLAHELTHTLQQGASNHHSSPASVAGGSQSVATKRISRKNKKTISRREANMAAAVSLAKGEAGKVIANKEGADGFRYGWPRLTDYFKTTLGSEKIIPDGQAGDSTSVPESAIKKKKDATGVAVIMPDGKPGIGTRDAMPSWCGIFAFWALNKAGLPMKKWVLGNMTIPREAALAPGTTPPPGAIAYRDLRSHYGLVEHSDGTSVTTINGNTAGADNLGGEVQVQTHALSNWTAFIDPMKLVEGTVRSPQLGVEEKPKSLRELRQELFNVHRKEDQPGATKEGQTKTEVTSAVQVASVAQKAEAAPEEELQRREEKQPQAPLLQRKEFAPGKGNVPGTAVQRQAAPRVQRGIFGAIRGAISGAAEWVGDRLEEGKRWLLGKVRDLIMRVPGYKALRVTLGYDPITGEEVAFNGKNFIDAALDIMPGGDLLKRKMAELGILEKAEQFVDSTIGRVKNLVSGISDTFSDFWNGISLSDVRNVPGVFAKLENAFTSFFNQIISFAKGVASDFLNFIKQALLIPLALFIKTKTRFWDLLCLAMGKDPLTDEVKPLNGANMLNAFLNLSEWGVEQKKKMQETGTFNKVAAWIDKGISIFSKSYQMLKAAFLGLWNYVNIESLMHPVDTFNKIFDSFWQPIKQIGDYVIETGIMILKIVKDVLFKWISAEGKKRKGYYLITVLISKDPFTGEKVPRTTENIIKGFMMLSEGGEEQFNKMKESGAMDRATQKIDAAVKTLGFSWAYVKGLFTGLWESLTWKDLLVPVMAFVKIIDTFKDPVARLIRFVITVMVALFEVILRMMGFPVDLVFKLIENVKKAWNSIKSNVSGFFINLLRAIKQGFIQFFDNVLSHLINGLKEWFLSEVQAAGIPIPTDFTVVGLLKWLLVVLDITMAKIWKKLEERMGKEKVDKIKRLIDRAEQIAGAAGEAYEFIQDVRKRGFLAVIADKIKEKLSNVWDMVLEAVKSFVMDQIIKKVTAKLLSMLDPTGIMAVVNSVMALYKAIQSFIRYLARILEIVNSFVEGTIEIAQGAIQKAGDFLEGALSRGVPVVIGFLANQVGLNLSERLRDALELVREKVDVGLTWVIDKLVTVVERLVEMGKSVIAAIKNWWKARTSFHGADGKQHTIYFEGTGETATLTVRSEPQPYTKFLQTYEDQLDATTKAAKKAAIDKAKDKAKEIEKEKQREIKGDTDEAKKTDEDKKASTIETLVSELGKLSEPLFGTEKPADSEISIKPEGGSKSTFATSMVADKIYKTPFVTSQGSGPTSAKHDIYDDLDHRQKGKGSYYIRGHLLNDKLGGPGSWTNLTALSRTGNSEHESSVESLVKAAFDAGAIIHYTVESKGNLPVTEPAESDKPRFVKVADINASFPIIKKIIHAEKQVCQELKCVAYTMKKEGTAWVNDTLIVDKTVTNSIETAYESYELGEDVQPPTVNLNSALTDQLERLSAIGAAKAQAIIIYRSDPANLLSSGKYFDKVEDLSKVEGVGAATIASLKNDKLVVT